MPHDGAASGWCAQGLPDAHCHDGARRACAAFGLFHRPWIMPTSSDSSAHRSLPACDSVPLIDVRRSFAALRSELLTAIERVCASGNYVLGPECAQLEKSVAEYCRAPFAVGCASGSDALLLACMALDLGPGDEVLMPSYTFFATASAVWRLGAKPVFVDIDPDTFNLDPEQLAAKVSPATKAIIPVHLYGQCAAMDDVLDIAKRHRLAVIEDAAQAIGAEHRGRPAGSLGDIGCLSFYPTKNLGAMGDGGMLVTGREDLDKKLRLLRTHGMEPRYYHHVVGVNSRLDGLQAAILNVKLPHLELWTRLREQHARRYRELFSACELDRVLGLPEAMPGCRHVWNQYVVRVPNGNRDALREHLRQQQVASEVYYPVPLHLQKCFQSLGYREGSLPETERAAQETLALPVFAEMTHAEQDVVVRHTAAFFGVEPPRLGHKLQGPHFLKQAGQPSSAATSGATFVP